jgi:hypothetical protein
MACRAQKATSILDLKSRRVKTHTGCLKMCARSHLLAPGLGRGPASTEIRATLAILMVTAALLQPLFQIPQTILVQ